MLRHNHVQSGHLRTVFCSLTVSECRIREGVTGIHLPLDRQGRSTGRAFIELEHEEDVGKALEKHRQYLGPRYIEGSSLLTLGLFNLKTF